MAAATGRRRSVRAPAKPARKRARGLDRLFTIGAIGFGPRTFFGALAKARVDLFVDLRARRGVRGHEYAFVNANRLQAALAKAGIPYVHALELAPSEAARALQAAADARSHTPTRQRHVLSPEYVRAYKAERLAHFDPEDFARRCLAESRRPVLFCVEREPAACHRSLVAAVIAKGLGVTVQNLKPPE